MDLYKEYPAHIVFLRRAFAVVAGVLALPVMLFWKDRARFSAICTASGRKPARSRCGWIRPRKRPAISTDTKTTHSNKKTANSNVAVFLSLGIRGPLGGFRPSSEVTGIYLALFLAG